MDEGLTHSCLRGCRPGPVPPFTREFARPTERDNRDDPDKDVVRREGVLELIGRFGEDTFA